MLNSKALVPNNKSKKRKFENEDNNVTNQSTSQRLKKSDDAFVYPKFKKFSSEKYEKLRYTILDNMARVMEGTEKGCTALAFINYKILVADNGVNSNKLGVKPIGTNYKIVNSMIKYWQNFANENINSQKRKEIFKLICVNRVSAEGSGYIKVDEKIIGDLALIALDDIDNNKAFSFNPRNYPKYYPIHLYCAYAIARTLAKDFAKVEKFIVSYPMTELVLAIKSFQINIVSTNRSTKKKSSEDECSAIKYDDYNLMHANKDYGWVILAMNKAPKQKEKPVHAENKILSYFLMTRIIREGLASMYLGISKLSCFDCSILIDAFNSVGVELKIDKLLIHRGPHDLDLDTGKSAIFKKVNGFSGFLTRPKGTPLYFEKFNDLTNLLDFDNTNFYTSVDGKVKPFKGKRPNSVNLFIYIDGNLQERIVKKYQELLLTKQKRDGSNKASQYDYSSSDNTPNHSPDKALISDNITKSIRKLINDLVLANNPLGSELLSLLTVYMSKMRTNLESKFDDIDDKMKIDTISSPNISRDIYASSNAGHNIDEEYKYQFADIEYIQKQLYTSKISTKGILMVPIGGHIDSDNEINVTSFDILQSHKSFLDSQPSQSLFGAFNIELYHWISYKITRKDNTYIIYYKDPKGSKQNNMFETLISKVLGQNVSYKCHTGCEQSDLTSCGVFALENIILLSNLTDAQLEKFEDLIFYTPTSDDLLAKREEFATIYNQQAILEKDAEKALLDKREVMREASSNETIELARLFNSINGVIVEIDINDSITKYFYRITIPINLALKGIRILSDIFEEGGFKQIDSTSIVAFNCDPEKVKISPLTTDLIRFQSFNLSSSRLSNPFVTPNSSVNDLTIMSLGSCSASTSPICYSPQSTASPNNSLVLAMHDEMGKSNGQQLGL